MDQMVDTRKFSEIWDRVTAVGETPAPPAGPSGREETETLRELLARESRSLGRYRALAARFSRSGSGSAFRQLARNAEGCVRQLQLRYFLLAGDSFTPPAEKPESAPALTALREAYAWETETASEYRKAAVGARDGKLQALYAGLLERALQRAEKLERMLAAALR